MLTVNQKEMDLGTVVFGQSRSFQYILGNDGDSEIKLTRVVLGCGSCTTASVNKAIVLPGQEAIIDTVFTPGSTGPALKGMNVEWSVNGESQPPLYLKFRANVVNG